MRREARTLIAWVTAHENNASGSPYVGQATIVRDTPKVARLDYVELVDGARSTLVLEIVRTATHAAADSGFRTVVIDLVSRTWRSPASGLHRTASWRSTQPSLTKMPPPPKRSSAMHSPILDSGVATVTRPAATFPGAGLAG